MPYKVEISDGKNVPGLQTKWSSVPYQNYIFILYLKKTFLELDFVIVPETFFSRLLCVGNAYI